MRRVFVTAVQLRNVLGSNYHLPTAWRARKPIRSGKIMTTISGHRLSIKPWLRWGNHEGPFNMAVTPITGSSISSWSQWLFCSPSMMVPALSALLQWGSFVLSDSWMGQCSVGQKFCLCDLSILDHCQLLQSRGSFCKDKGLGLWSHKSICSLELGYYSIKPFILLMKRAWSMSNRQ